MPLIVPPYFHYMLGIECKKLADSEKGSPILARVLTRSFVEESSQAQEPCDSNCAMVDWTWWLRLTYPDHSLTMISLRPRSFTRSRSLQMYDGFDHLGAYLRVGSTVTPSMATASNLRETDRARYRP
jgi:hypothetical protein